MADHALITKLIIHWSPDCACTDHVAEHQWSRGWSCTDHVIDHALIIWLIMHWSRGWSYTDHVTDHALNSLVAQTVKNPPAICETWVRSLGWEDPLEKGMATHSSVLAWRIPWTEEPGRPQSIVLQRVRHDWSNLACSHRTKWNYGVYYKVWNGFLFIWLPDIQEIFSFEGNRIMYDIW